MKIPFVRLVLLFFICVNIFFSSLFISWQLNKSADYFYPFFYEKLEIGEHIKKYAPFNEFKKGYEDVGAQEHKRVFREIVHHVHGFGIGLNDLSYYSLQGDYIDKALTSDEVEHLQEVAQVVTWFGIFGLFNIVLTIVIVFLSLRRKLQLPSFKYVCMIGAVGFLICTLILALIGFDKVFYEFHKLLFSDAPWIFSYRESLLIVLTKSPQLFAILGLTIFIPAFILFLIFMYGLCFFSIREKYKR